MGMDRYTKQLHHRKSQKVTTGTGEPAVDLGGNGSISIRDVNGQIVLFAKYNGDWYSRDLGHNTRMGEKHLTHLTIDDSGINAMDGPTSLAHFGQTLRIGEDSSSKSALRVASDGSITIGTSAAAAVTITSAGAGTFAGALSATSGTVGGWTIGSTKISTGSGGSYMSVDKGNLKIQIGAKDSRDDGNTGVHLGTDGLGIGANGVFVVTAAGEITATSATITGAITCGSGSSFSGRTWNGNAISTALQTSGSDNTNFYQDDPPTALKAGDLWFDTNDNHKAYRAAAAGADQVTSGEWVAVVTNATNITAGTLDCSGITVSNINAGSITAGNLNADRISGGTLTIGNISFSGTISTSNTAAKCTDPNADQTSANTANNAANYTGNTIGTGYGGTGATNLNALQNSRITTNANGTLNYDATSATAPSLSSITGTIAKTQCDTTIISGGKIVTDLLTASNIQTGNLLTNKLNFASAGGNVYLTNTTPASFLSGNCVFVGFDVGANIASGGDDNVAIGDGALNACTSGAKNVCIGSDAGKLIDDGDGSTGYGDENICIGFEAGDNLTTGKGCVFIGQGNFSSATNNEQLVIRSGNSGGAIWMTGDSTGDVTFSGDIKLGEQKGITFDTSATRIEAGSGTEDLRFFSNDDMNFYPDDDFSVYAGNQTSLSFSLMSDGKIYMPHFHNDQGVAGNLSLGTGGFMYVGTSDARHKNVITTNFDGLSLVNKLTPTYFTWKDDYQYRNGQDLGFIAQEVYLAIPEAVRGDVDNGDILSLGNKAIVAALTKAVQELSAKVTALEAKVG